MFHLGSSSACLKVLVATALLIPETPQLYTLLYFKGLLPFIIGPGYAYLIVCHVLIL